MLIIFTELVSLINRKLNSVFQFSCGNHFRLKV